jgi:pyruvate/2-oxoglutarate dehydrogenase complex dihydrolipoamide dehydrogenase (E3) component
MWAVVGGGPCGIGAVGKLVDAGHRLVWIDPNFSDIGRMGRCYRGVPANTPNGSLWDTFLSCSSFEIEKYLASSKKKASQTYVDLNRSECSHLGYFVDVLEHASLTLRSHPLVTSITGAIESMVFSDHWTLSLSSEEESQRLIKADFVVLAIGAVPTLPSNLPPASLRHDLDLMINYETAQKYFCQHTELLSQPWAVVGSSHRSCLLAHCSHHFQCNARDQESDRDRRPSHRQLLSL